MIEKARPHSSCHVRYSPLDLLKYDAESSTLKMSEQLFVWLKGNGREIEAENLKCLYQQVQQDAKDGVIEPLNMHGVTVELPQGMDPCTQILPARFTCKQCNEYILPKNKICGHCRRNQIKLCTRYLAYLHRIELRLMPTEKQTIGEAIMIKGGINNSLILEKRPDGPPTPSAYGKRCSHELWNAATGLLKPIYNVYAEAQVTTHSA